MFDYKEVFNFSNPKSLYYLFISLFFIIPAFNPAIFQRIAMASTVQQVSNSFIISAVTCLLLVLIVSWIGILMLAIHPNIGSTDIIRRIVSDYSFIIGYRGVALAGIMAMIMSTVDSFINSSAVILTHDVLNTLKVRFIKNELFTARIVSLWIGVFSLILSLRDNSLLELIIVTYSLYMPIVTVPFIMAILGFRSTEKSVLIGMSAGLLTVIAWDYLLQIKSVNSVPLGMLANLVSLIGSHYLLKQRGGWIGIKDYTPVIAIRNERRKKAIRFLHGIKNFNILDICKKNCPKGDGLISILGIFIMISLSISTHTLPKEYQLHYKYLIDAIYPVILFSSTALISYPLWLKKWKEIDLIALVWNLIIFLVVICFSFLMVLISNFTEIQLMPFLVNIIMLSTIISWRWALFTITVGVMATSIYYQHYISVDLATTSLSSQFKIAYLLLLIISILLAFLKPKQQYQELTEEKNEHLNSRLSVQNKELEEALAIKAEFLRNIPHEYHAAMTRIISTSETLKDAYDKLSDKHRKMAIDNIFSSSISLKSFDDNLTTLARLSKPDYKLHKEDIDFSALVHDRVQTCCKYYEENREDRDFVLDIKDGVIIHADKSYMIHLLDNLIINAIKYCKKGKISIILRKSKKDVNFVIADEGIGIPKTELYDIFEPFTFSSKTRTPAGGRGIGLSVCKRIVEAHKGSISADSDGEAGATLRFVLPL